MGWDWQYRDEDYPALAKLRKNCGDAARNLQQLRAERDEFVERARKAAFDSWTKRYGASLSTFEHAVDVADRALSEKMACIRLAESSASLPYPEGTVVEEMRRPKYSYHGLPTATGKKGVLQIFRAGDKYPSTLAKYSVPDVGSVVVRELKKDGTPGLVVKKLAGWGNWYKDGKLVKLKEKESK